MGTRIPSDMCVGKHASLGICMRETRIPAWETHIPVTPACTFAREVATYRRRVSDEDKGYGEQRLWVEILE